MARDAGKWGHSVVEEGKVGMASTAVPYDTWDEEIATSAFGLLAPEPTPGLREEHPRIDEGLPAATAGFVALDLQADLGKELLTSPPAPPLTPERTPGLRGAGGEGCLWQMK